MAKAASIDPAELSRPQTHVSVQRYFERPFS